ncbi:ATP-binding cassette domain-containing protein, partial [Thioclava sp. BHET1]
LAAIFLFHPYLGWLAVAGGTVLILIAVINQITSLAPGEQARRTAATSARQAEQIRAQVETVRALGMTDVIIARWRGDRDLAVEAEIGLSDRNGSFAALTKSLRLLLQSAMLGLGAWLVIQEQLTAGAMVASSIMLGRALAPIEQIVGGWAVVSRARKGWGALQRLLGAVPQPRSHMPLAPPKARLSVNDITVIPPGARQPVLRNVSFSLYPGQVLGVVGESASGKSSVARALTGIWPLVGGEIRLDGATLEQYGEEALARHIGYLPQDVALFDATIAENIARLSPSPRPEDVIRAATEANAHEMILSLPQGYDTPIGHAGAKLSGGQKQRVGLARAMYGNPVVVILDEPNSNLDAPGTEAVNLAIRHLKQAGKAVVVMAHRPAALAE